MTPLRRSPTKRRALLPRPLPSTLDRASRADVWPLIALGAMGAAVAGLGLFLVVRA